VSSLARSGLRYVEAVIHLPAQVQWLEDSSDIRWVEEALHGWPTEGFHVRDLVPPRYEVYLDLLHDPGQGIDEQGTWSSRAKERGIPLGPETTSWEIFLDPVTSEWIDAPFEGSLTRDEVRRVVGALEAHTTSPEECRFLLWAGWGDLLEGGYAVVDVQGGRPILEESAAHRRAQLELDRMSTVELLGRSGRRYIPFRGPVAAAVGSFASPSSSHRSANLWWPVDRAWFVHTEIDGHVTHLGGSAAALEAVASSGVEYRWVEASSIASG